MSVPPPPSSSTSRACMHLLRLERLGVAADDPEMATSDAQTAQHALDLGQRLGQHVVVHAPRGVEDHRHLGKRLAQAGRTTSGTEPASRRLAVAEVDPPGDVGGAAANRRGEQPLPADRRLEDLVRPALPAGRRVPASALMLFDALGDVVLEQLLSSLAEPRLLCYPRGARSRHSRCRSPPGRFRHRRCTGSVATRPHRQLDAPSASQYCSAVQRSGRPSADGVTPSSA